MVIENAQKRGLLTFLLSKQLLPHRQSLLATQALWGTKVTPWDLQVEENTIAALVGWAINADFPLQPLKVEFCMDGLAVAA